MTRQEKSDLECYLLMSTNFRKDEAAAWKELAEQKDEDRKPKFKNAKSNYEYLVQRNEFIESFIKRLQKY